MPVEGCEEVAAPRLDAAGELGSAASVIVCTAGSGDGDDGKDDELDVARVAEGEAIEEDEEEEEEEEDV